MLRAQSLSGVKPSKPSCSSRVTLSPRVPHISAPVVTSSTSPRVAVITRSADPFAVSSTSPAPIPVYAWSGLKGADRDQWESSVIALVMLGMKEEAAEKTIGRAFGWTTKAYWRSEKKEEVPPVDQVSDALSFLESLGMTEKEIAFVVGIFPEVVACDVDKQLAVSVAKLKKDWKMEGEMLKKTVMRRPQVLGYTVDCGGDCIGDCNKCWIRF